MNVKKETTHTYLNNAKSNFSTTITYTNSKLFKIITNKSFYIINITKYEGHVHDINVLGYFINPKMANFEFF